MHTSSLSISLITRFFRGLKRVCNYILDFIFPNSCVGCGSQLKNGALLCTRCLPLIPIKRTLMCSTCHMRYKSEALCHPHQPYVLTAAKSYAQPLVRTLIHELKFEYMRTAAKPLAKIIIRHIKKCPQLASLLEDKNLIIIPIPLHKDRERIRGFNQTFEIGTLIAKYLDIECRNDVLIKRTPTRPQHELTRGERLVNIQDCFSVQNKDPLMNRTVMLIDDVLTTGTTLAVAANTILQHGTARVYALAVAHTPSTTHGSHNMI
jgi:competence protein ComFC